MILVKSQNFVCCTKFRVCTLLKCMKIFRRFTSSKISSPVLQITFLPCTLEASYLISHSKNFLGHSLKIKILGHRMSINNLLMYSICNYFRYLFISALVQLIITLSKNKFPLFLICYPRAKFRNQFQQLFG